VESRDSTGAVRGKEEDRQKAEKNCGQRRREKRIEETRRAESGEGTEVAADRGKRRD
jgi:hypothetical protein